MIRVDLEQTYGQVVCWRARGYVNSVLVWDAWSVSALAAVSEARQAAEAYLCDA